MKNDDFEQFLAEQPLRSIPPEWSAEILRTARLPRPLENAEPRTSWWRELIWPSPVAWGCLACVWLLIIIMNLAAEPSGGRVAMPVSASSTEACTAIMQERRLVQEFSQYEEEPAEPPRKRQPSGASLERRTRNPELT